MSFSIGYVTDAGRNSGSFGGTEAFPINQNRVVDLSSQTASNNQMLSVGDQVWPIVDAVLGARRDGERIRYAPNDHTVTYVVTGGTLTYEIRRL